MMKNGIFYGIGVGPGDPELITIKAVNTLKKVDVVAFPESSKEKSSVALAIASPYLKEDVEMLELPFPMIRDTETREKTRRENASLIKQEIETGRNVAFLTLGDPMLYSTYIYLLENLKTLPVEIETIPGIYSFSAISNQLNMPLVKGDESMAVISSLDEKSWEVLQGFDTIVCMKATSYKHALSDMLTKANGSFRFTMVSNLGHTGETITHDLEKLNGELPYFTTVLLKKN